MQPAPLFLLLLPPRGSGDAGLAGRGVGENASGHAPFLGSETWLGLRTHGKQEEAGRKQEGLLWRRVRVQSRALRSSPQSRIALRDSLPDRSLAVLGEGHLQTVQHSGAVRL